MVYCVLTRALFRYGFHPVLFTFYFSGLSMWHQNVYTNGEVAVALAEGNLPSGRSTADTIYMLFVFRIYTIHNVNQKVSFVIESQYIIIEFSFNSESIFPI